MKRPSPKPVRRTRARTGTVDRKWVYNLVSESLFTFGSTDQARRAAYRGADGQMRFLPLDL
jgi:hypothetical protein